MAKVSYRTILTLTPECVYRLWFFHRRAPTSPHAPTTFSKLLCQSAGREQRTAGDTYNTHQWVLLLLLFLNILLFLIYDDLLTTSDAALLHTQTVVCLDTSPLQSESELSFITLIGNQPILSQHLFYFLTFWKSLKDVYILYILYILFIYRFVSNLFFNLFIGAVLHSCLGLFVSFLQVCAFVLWALGTTGLKLARFYPPLLIAHVFAL